MRESYVVWPRGPLELGVLREQFLAQARLRIARWCRRGCSREIEKSQRAMAAKDRASDKAMKEIENATK